MKQNKSTILLIILLLVALVGAMALSKQTQETRRGAYFAGASMMVLPEPLTGTVGSDVTAHLWVESTAKVQNAQYYFCYGGNELELPVAEINDRVKRNESNGFDSIALAKVEDNNGVKCLNLTVVSDNNDRIKSGTIEVATVKFKAIAAGTGGLQIVKEKSKVSGYNPDGTDQSIEVTTVTNATYTITANGGAEPTAEPSVSPSATDPYLNFRMTFSGVTPSAQCANWKVQLMVMGPNNVRKTFNDVSLTKDGEVGGLQIYKGSVRLVGFAPNSGVAAFIKGPKHLQVKYGANGQDKFYNKVGGELSGLTNDSATSPTFDFTKYPLLAGDVTGDTPGQQDGVADGRDFSYIKAEIAKNSSVTAGGNLPADLNGNCAYESQDVALFMISLREKQEQLY